MQDHQAMALAEGSLPAAPATAPSQRIAESYGQGEPVAGDFFVDPFNGWACWIPRWPEAKPEAAEAPMAGPRRACDQGLLGRVGAWFGVCQQTPSGAWKRIHVPRRDPWEPGARRYGTVWHWWC
jgi:hypothetical protein